VLGAWSVNLDRPFAQCCAQFDVPFNTQLEMERQHQIQGEDPTQPPSPDGPFTHTPIMPCDR